SLEVLFSRPFSSHSRTPAYYPPAERFEVGKVLAPQKTWFPTTSPLRKPLILCWDVSACRTGRRMCRRLISDQTSSLFESGNSTNLVHDCRKSPGGGPR